jgi:PAS domain-containing protein
MFRKQFSDLQSACAFANAIVATVREPLVVLDQDLRVIAASRSFYRTFKANPGETEGQLLYASWATVNGIFQSCVRFWENLYRSTARPKPVR